MKELTDLEICKRIAEIEGVDANESLMQVGSCYIPTGRGLVDENFIQYNPLTDDALCFKLRIKYGIWRWSNPCEGKFNVCIRGVGGWVSYETLNKAICLAIIESQGE
jgi:hypothetical protein